MQQHAAGGPRSRGSSSSATPQKQPGSSSALQGPGEEAAPSGESGERRDEQLRLRLQTSYFLPSLDCASSVVCCPDGSLCISNTGSHKLVFMSPETGEQISTFAERNTTNRYGSFRGPRGLACDLTSLYVSDCYNCAIKKFNLSDHRMTAVTGSYGEGDGQLRYPNGLALAPDGTLFVADSSNGRIAAYDSENLNFRFWFPLERGPARSKGVMQALTKAGLAAHSTAPRAHLRPAGLAILNEELFVTDAYNRRIQVFSLTGVFRRFLQPTVEEGTTKGQLVLTLPEGLAAASGRLFVSDKRGDAVHIIDCKDGTAMQMMPFLVQKPHGLSGVATDGLRVYIIDEARSEVQVLTNFYAEASRKAAAEGAGAGPTPRSSGPTPRKTRKTTPRAAAPAPSKPPAPPRAPAPSPAQVKAEEKKAHSSFFKRSAQPPSITPVGSFHAPSAAQLRARDPDGRTLALKTKEDLDTPRSVSSIASSSQLWTPRGSTPLLGRNPFGRKLQGRKPIQNQLKLEVVI